MATTGDSAVKVAKDAMFLDTATSVDLDRLGNMFLVERSPVLGTSVAGEEIYRRLIQLLAFQPKQVLKIVYDLIGVLFGTQEDLIAASKRPWKVFEVIVNEIIIEIPLALTQAANVNATYLHGLGGEDNGFTGGLPDFFFVVGENFSSAASSLVGLPLTVNGITYTILAHTYVPLSQTNVFQITTPTLPPNVPSAKWRVVIPSSVSFIGDYLLSSPLDSAIQVDNNIVVLFGEGLIELLLFYLDLLVVAAGVRVRVERI